MNSVQVLGLRPRRRCLPTAVCSSNVVVVESPAKAKKIQGYLGSDFQVRRYIVGASTQ